MAVEVCSYSLTLRGSPVGTHVLRTEHRGATTHLEGRLQLQGSLGQLSTTQVSRVHRKRRASLAYQESTERKGDNRSYEVEFDIKSGLVTATRGGNDQATAPYIAPYRDPLGLLDELRGLGELDEPVRLPMLGKDVAVLYLGKTVLDSIYGEREAFSYRLHPGNAYVYVDTEEPHQILQMTQPTEGHLLDAILVKVAQEDAMPSRGASSAKSRRPRRRRRRRRKR